MSNAMVMAGGMVPWEQNEKGGRKGGGVIEMHYIFPCFDQFFPLVERHRQREDIPAGVHEIPVQT